MLATRALTMRKQPTVAALIAYLKAIPGCVSCWALQENEAATTAVDEVAARAPGTMTATISGRRGLIGKACNFNGSTSRIDMAATKEATNSLAAVTVIALHKPTTVAGGNGVYAEDVLNDVTAAGRIHCFGNVSVTHFARTQYRASVAETQVAAAGTVANWGGNWQLTAWDVDVANDLASIWTNGVRDLQSSNAQTLTAFENAQGATPPSIGYIAPAAASFYLGSINFVVIYNRLLTVGEHQAIYRAIGGIGVR